MNAVILQVLLWITIRVFLIALIVFATSGIWRPLWNLWTRGALHIVHLENSSGAAIETYQMRFPSTPVKGTQIALGGKHGGDFFDVIHVSYADGKPPKVTISE